MDTDTLREELKAPENFDPHEWKKFDKASQRQILHALDQAKKEKRGWYCKRGRTCDGSPHEGMDYPHARSDQWPPAGTDWMTWLLRSGRGAGKTRSGAEWIRSVTRKVERIAMIGRRGPDVRGTMVEGDSGLIAVCERAGMSYEWYPSRKEFHFGNGAVAYGFSGEEPDTLRGPQFGAAWLDEPAHMPLIDEVWYNLLFGLRLKGLPGGAKVLCTSTPLPLKWLRELEKDPTTVTVRVSTYANAANLDEQFKRVVLSKYEGTRLGQQELHGQILEDIEGALWSYSMIEPYRIPKPGEEGHLTAEDMDRIVVSIDPSGSSSKRRDETGIIAVGKRGDHYYILEDHSGHYTPEGWARAAWSLYDKLNADVVVAEKNYGGEMVKSTLHNHRPDGNVKLVHSRRGKQLRAEPVVGLYEQGRVHHAEGLDKLEEQQCEWVPGDEDSPDRVDGTVHGVIFLSGAPAPASMGVPGRDMGGTPAAAPHQYGVGSSRYTGLVDRFGRPLTSVS